MACFCVVSWQLAAANTRRRHCRNTDNACGRLQGLSPSGREVNATPQLAEPGALDVPENETAAMQFMMEAFERELKQPIRNLITGASPQLQAQCISSTPRNGCTFLSIHVRSVWYWRYMR